MPKYIVPTDVESVKKYKIGDYNLEKGSWSRVYLHGEAIAYGYYEYKGKTTSAGDKISEKHINKLVAAKVKENGNLKIGEKIKVYDRDSKKLVFSGKVGDNCPSKPRNEGNDILIDCFLNTKKDCSKFGCRNVIIFVLK